jgi:hypothetical protein
MLQMQFDDQKEIIDVLAMTGTEGLEVYIVSRLEPNVAGKNYPYQGILMTGTGSARTLAHEIGHECGWGDIYTSAPGQPQMTMPLSQSHLSPADWNNGPGPQEYYPRGLPLAAVIKRCLMFGYTSGGHDLPMGSVKGYDRDGIFGFVRGGTYGMDRFPKHNN